MFASSMRLVGVADDCLADVKVALTEACTNVLDHAIDGDDYEVVCYLDDDKCVIEVIDRGHGFDHVSLGETLPATDSEAGRGIQLMRTLVDQVQFVSRPRGGTVVHLE